MGLLGRPNLSCYIMILKWELPEIIRIIKLNLEHSFYNDDFIIKYQFDRQMKAFSYLDHHAVLKEVRGYPDPKYVEQQG